MKTLKDIQVGDSVLVYALHTLVWTRVGFWVKTEVLKVTKTQLTTKYGRHKKDNGRGIGDSPQACIEGGKYCGTEVLDQSEQLATFKKNVTTAYKIEDVLEFCKFKHDSKNLDEILELVLLIEKLLKGE